MIPEGWDKKTIKDCLDKVIDYRGKAPPKSDHGVRLITARNIRFGKLDLTHAEFIDENLYESWMNRGRPCGTDVLFTTEAPLGNACMFPNEGIYAVGQRAITLRTKTGVLDSNFLLNYLLSSIGQNEIHRRSSGSTATGIKSKEFVKIQFFLPPLTEQKAIGEILTTWDQAIEKTEALIANSEAQKKALMQQLLTGKKRLPGFDGKWQSDSFDTLFKRVRDRNVELNENVLTISAQLGLVSQLEYFNKSVAGKNLSGYTLLKEGDFAYNKSYSAGYPMGAIKPLELYKTGIVSSLYICFRILSEEAHHDFYRHYFEAGFFDREIYGIAQEGARNHGLLNVSVTDFFLTQIIIPELEEQIAIADVITAAEEEITKLKEFCSDLKSEKSALMQQLLTGKRRVKIEEVAA